MKATDEHRICLLDGNRGIYLPQSFTDHFDATRWNIDISSDDFAALVNGPDDEYYWEAWDTIICNARCLDTSGVTWCLVQDGDLFAVAIDDNGEPIEHDDN